VDYWPVNEDLPAAPAVAGLVASAPAIARDITIDIPRPVAHAVRPSPQEIIVTPSRTPVIATPSSEPTIALEAAPVPASLPPDVVVVESLQAVAIDQTFDLETPPMPDSMSEESRRLFGDALRRTKVRIAAARVFINDAMSGVVGAFRKMSPFFQATAFVPGLD
jgi:hypothetical protein